MKHELKELARDAGRLIYKFLSHRILWLLVATVLLFYLLLVQLFRLQIVEATTNPFGSPAPRTGYVSRSLPPLRGTIYDRHGRPLAINTLTYVAKMDPSVRITDEALLDLALLFEANGENYVDSFPISHTRPFEFTIAGTTQAQIERREYRWKADMAIPDPANATAEAAWYYLRNHQFNIDPELSDADARRIMNLRSMIFEQRFLGWGANYDPTPFVIAYDISPETIAAIAEQRHFFSGVFTDVQTTRVYPAGRYVSHMIGYLRPITAQQLAQNQHLGYTENDLFGRAGLELSMEQFLRGTPGRERFEVNAAGRMISTPIRYVEPIPGDRIFLTIDLELQMAAYYALEDALAQALINRFTLRHHTERPITPEEVFISMVNAHNLNLRAVLEAEPDSLAYPMQRYILTRDPEANIATVENRNHINGMIAEGITNRRISPAMMLLTLIGTGQITDPDGTIETRLINQPNTAQAVLIEKIRARELTPQMLNMDPATGSLIITCIHTGAVLAAATYPSYDNNRLVNHFDNDYWLQINTLDPTHPMVNRPFREARAPGSTFKMFTAVAGLENGVIGPNSRIFDRVAFTAAGRPYLRCWHSGGHGNINVAQAIAVSCNFFFADVAFRLGGNGQSNIEVFNHYMNLFGLGDPSGVEIGEHPIDFRNRGFMGSTLASPEFKRHIVSSRNPFAAAYELNWFDGDTVHASIGQGFVNHTAAQMVRGMATIGNRGTNYELFLVGHTEDPMGNVTSRTTPTATNHGVEVSDATWDVVIEGMRLVTEPGAGGTAVNAWRGAPIRVAGKTGTAQEVSTRFSHSTFGAFAPLHDPQIAIYVNIPFGATAAHTQIATRIAREMVSVALGYGNEPEHPQPHNHLRR